MARLNPKNDITKKIIHLVVTQECDRDCPDCCNKQYNMNKIEVVTNQELMEANKVFITGGEPFAYSNPCDIAATLKSLYPNIKRIYVYTNATELWCSYKQGFALDLYAIDGLTISIKSEWDKRIFEHHLQDNPVILSLKSNYVYVFEPYQDMEIPKPFVKKLRYWQKDFIPDPNSIFRRLHKYV